MSVDQITQWNCGKLAEISKVQYKTVREPKERITLSMKQFSIQYFDPTN